MPAKDTDDARFDKLGAQISGRPGRDQYCGDGRTALGDLEAELRARHVDAPLITHHCPNCEAMARKLDQVASARESELQAENARLREANRRLQAEGPALERDKLVAGLREEVKSLQQWKREACEVIGKWERVHEALGKPGKLGKSKADGALAEVERLRAELADNLAAAQSVAAELQEQRRAAQADAESWREKWEKASADVAALRQFLDAEVMPRYAEMFDQAFGGNSLVVIEAKNLLETPNPGAALLAELASLREHKRGLAFHVETALTQARMAYRIADNEALEMQQEQLRCVIEQLTELKAKLDGKKSPAIEVEPPEYSRRGNDDEIC